METYEEILERMKQTFAQQAGYEVEKNSDLEIRMQVLAGELYSSFANIEWLKRQVFPQTATGEYWTMHGTQRGLVRKESQAAVGSLTFSRTSALSYDLPIPVGTVCAVDKEDTVRYITTEEATLKANELSVTVKAKAKEGGRNGNTAENTIQIMITPPSGIKAVTNAEPFIGGMDAEDDNAFRARLLKSYANISNGTNAAFYRELAMKHPSVYSAGVVAKDDGVGTVSVYVATRGGVPSDEVIEELQNQFDEARELNVAVTVKPAVLQKIPLRIQIKPAEQYSFEQAKEICMQVVDDYFAQMHIGGIFRVAELCRNMLESGAIVNHFTPPGEDFSTPQNKLVVKGNIIIEEGGVI